MPKPQLDHIVILIPHSTLISPPPLLTQTFNLTPGGVHAGGLTENKLIIFSDGSYLELISFVDDNEKKREGHWWGEKEYGIIDFALSTGDGAWENWDRLEKRLGELDGGVRYLKPKKGGRIRPDGEKVEWEVTFPVTGDGYQRGQVPFWCHDVTRRGLRVPLGENMKHPSGAEGVAELSVKVEEGRLEQLKKDYAGIVGVEGDGGVFEVGKAEGGKNAHIIVEEEEGISKKGLGPLVVYGVDNKDSKEGKLVFDLEKLLGIKL